MNMVSYQVNTVSYPYHVNTVYYRLKKISNQLNTVSYRRVCTQMVLAHLSKIESALSLSMLVEVTLLITQTHNGIHLIGNRIYLIGKGIQLMGNRNQ